ncbi:hypothetical protein Pth03_75410 [Planotetraspora thailandica]|uniref:Uncharacterized protein n=1 Tax=Planotetraspora thailandica TaxID=487172 RepID=A0A8J3Y1H9_9ACTN|nr:hypothetical protein [Planotetraspora thailandica]GII59152.1 hypothetical protein Pth03_75410 [Planotetraspora thailandica]
MDKPIREVMTDVCDPKESRVAFVRDLFGRLGGTHAAGREFLCRSLSLVAWAQDHQQEIETNRAARR